MNWFWFTLVLKLYGFSKEIVSGMIIEIDEDGNLGRENTVPEVILQYNALVHDKINPLDEAKSKNMDM